jgi:hypothetical protein
MVGEYFPIGWNGRQVSIDFIGAPARLRTRWSIPPRPGVSSNWCRRASQESLVLGESFTRGPPYDPSNCWRSCTSRVGPRLCPDLSNYRSSPSLSPSTRRLKLRLPCSGALG